MTVNCGCNWTLRNQVFTLSFEDASMESPIKMAIKKI